MNNYAKLEDLYYIKLRAQPLIKLNDTTFRVIHPLFVADKIYKGLFFLFKQLNEEDSKIIIGEFRTWYTTEFSEGICFKNLIEYSFEKFNCRFFDAELKVKEIVGPPDCYLRIEDNVYLFENKDIFINAKIKSSYDFETLINEIKKKLLIENEKPVGIGQLITNIRKLLTKENNYDTEFSPENTIIYPLLVVHDNMFDAIGFNRILQIFFEEELNKLKQKGLDVSRVKPLVVINIDTMILIADSLKENKFSLSELLESYYKTWSFKWNTTLLAEENSVAFQQTLLPFSHLITISKPEILNSNKLLESLFDKIKNNA